MRPRDPEARTHAIESAPKGTFEVRLFLDGEFVGTLDETFSDKQSAGWAVHDAAVPDINLYAKIVANDELGSNEFEGTLYTDGACRDNPGPGGCGIYLSCDDGETTFTHSSFLGTDMTNNQAEYEAIRKGVEFALDRDVTHLTIKSDSKLVVNQLTGEWDCNDDALDSLRQSTLDCLDELDSWEIEHIPREDNTKADKLANKALDEANY